MASTIDLSQFAFSEEQVRDINELVFDNIVKSPELSAIHTIFSGIVYDKEVGFLTGGGLVGVAAQGCNPTSQDYTIGSRVVKWTPKRWEARIEECYTDLENTAAIYAMNKGVSSADLTDTDYMAIVVDFMTQSIKDFYYRVAWFGDTYAENVGEGGQLTAGVDASYFNLIDGFFKQMATAVTANPALGVSIAANAEASKKAQFDSFTPQNAYDTLAAMYFGAPIDMRASGNMQFLVTQSVADKYQQFLMGKGIESEYKNLVDGVPSLSFSGVPVVVLPIWDKMIQSYHDKGATFHKPHRAVLVEKLNLGIGTGSTDALAKLNVWYDMTSRKNYVEAMDTIDAKLLNASRFMLAQ